MSDFSELEINAVYRVISQRRDMRHFLSDTLDDAVLCLGQVPAFYARPMLEEQNWAPRSDLRSVVTDCWSDPQTQD